MQEPTRIGPNGTVGDVSLVRRRRRRQHIHPWMDPVYEIVAVGYRTGMGGSNARRTATGDTGVPANQGPSI